jgi:signal transduction histidine kinase
MTTNEKYNGYLYKMSTHMRRGLSEVQKKVNELYKIEELEEYDSPIEHILAALVPLMVQVNDFHDYAETVTGKMELNLEETDVHAVLDSVLTIADQLVEDKSGVRLEEDIEENLPSLEADAERLTQALLNYIHNAVKFTESGTVTLRVKREGHNILFEVSDTGIGIPEKCRNWSSSRSRLFWKTRTTRVWDLASA